MAAVFLGGRWRELQVENEQMRDALGRVDEEKAALHKKIVEKQNQNEVLVAKLRETTLLYHETQEKFDRTLAELRKMTDDNWEHIHLWERAKMEKEDLRAENIWLYGKKDLGNTKNSVLVQQRDQLNRKLRISEHKLGLLSEWRTETEAKLTSLRSLCRTQELAIGKKDSLIRSLQREKTAIFQEVTRLRAQTPIDVSSLAKEKTKLERENRQLKMAPRELSSYDREALSEMDINNPWIG